MSVHVHCDICDEFGSPHRPANVGWRRLVTFDGEGARLSHIDVCPFCYETVHASIAGAIARLAKEAT